MPSFVEGERAATTGLLSRLVGEEELDGAFARACRRWRYDTMSMFCVYLALDAPVRWKAADWDEGVNECLAVSVCESLDVLDDNASDCRLGLPPRQPGLFTVHPSLFEPSLCPSGKEATFCEQIAPWELREGGHDAWEDVKDAVRDAWNRITGHHKLDADRMSESEVDRLSHGGRARNH